MTTKLARLKSAWNAGDKRGALAIAAKFLGCTPMAIVSAAAALIAEDEAEYQALVSEDEDQ